MVTFGAVVQKESFAFVPHHDGRHLFWP